MLNAKKEEDVLSYWSKQTDLVALFPVAKMYLAICASSAQDERSFSCAGSILSPNRTQLSMKHIVDEFRVRMYVNSSGSQHIQEERENRTKATDQILAKYSEWLDRCLEASQEKKQNESGSNTGGSNEMII